MTRSHKANDRPHAPVVVGAGAMVPEIQIPHLPKFFAKHGHIDAEPNKIKKNGAGKGNWGTEGEEVVDEHFNFAQPRRRSNSSSYASGEVKTKFEVNEQEPVFEESIHGPEAEDDDMLTKTDTASSNGSIADEDKLRKSV